MRECRHDLGRPHLASIDVSNFLACLGWRHYVPSGVTVKGRDRVGIGCQAGLAAIGDTTTLSNPEVVENLRQYVQSEKVARGQVPRELSPQEMEEIKAFGRAE